MLKIKKKGGKSNIINRYPIDITDKEDLVFNCDHKEDLVFICDPMPG
jgi:hypothetical protein